MQDSPDLSPNRLVKMPIEHRHDAPHHDKYVGTLREKSQLLSLLTSR